MKLIHHQLENGSDDPIETEFKGFDDLWEWAKYWAGLGHSPRVYLATFSDNLLEEYEASREIVVTHKPMYVRGLVYDEREAIANRNLTMHLQEFESFQEAYEVAFYIREGHPLAYRSTEVG